MTKQVQTLKHTPDHYTEGNAIAKAVELGAMFQQSGMFGVQNKAQADVLALECITRNLPPGILLERYHIVEGRLSLRADFMLAEFKRRGGRVKWIKTGSKADDFVAEATFEKDGSRVTESYSFEDAKEAKICFKKGSNDLKNNWRSSRPDMIRARLISKTVRFLDPGINSGFYTSEEIVDFDENSDLDLDIEETKVDIFTETAPKSSETAVKPKNEAAVDAEVIEEEKEAVSEPGEGIPEDPSEEVNQAEETFEGEFAELFEILVEKEEPVNAFLRSKNWIKPEQTFRDTPENWLKMMKERPGDFIAAAEKEFKGGQNG